jgi:antirestriction protein ArdC
MSEVYQYVTERILNALSRGVIPWRKPWNGTPNVPMNFVTRRPYRGSNRILLDPMVTGFRSPYWMTYKQAANVGGQVRKGEKSSMAVFWKFVEDRKNPQRKIPFLRYFNVFNLDQIDGIEVPQPVPNAIASIERAEQIVNGWSGPRMIENGGDKCCYVPSTDTISMAPRSTFCTAEAWYATLYHEMVHSTGHASRLDRLKPGREEYAREELVAELGASFLCEEAGIGNALTDNSAAYIAGWMRALQDDPKAIVIASGAAERAADLILGRNKPTDDTDE